MIIHNKSSDIQVKICVYNLFNASISVESSDIKFTTCGEYKHNTGAAGETTSVTWSYIEVACLFHDPRFERTGKYELSILGKLLFKSTFVNVACQFNLIIEFKIFTY